LEPLAAAAHADHLTEILRRSGVLDAGRVEEVVVESSRPLLASRVLRLRLSYDRPADAPSSLILKTGLPSQVDGRAGIGRREVEFYTRVAAAMPPQLVPRCFEAVWDPEAWHLLLEDLSLSHDIAAEWPLPPSVEQCERILDTIARLHAAWWDNPRLGASIEIRPDAESVNQHVQWLAAQFKVFADRLGDRLSSDRRAFYEQFLDVAPRASVGRLIQRGLTLVHGDAHVWNFFLPRDGGNDVRLFDWDSWRIGTASTDLAYMMATHWSPERRHRMERALLDRYHGALQTHGVSGYDRRALDDDYRWSVLWQIMTPVWQAALHLPPLIWWHHLERIFAAVDDLGCRELLG
jgi:thiamine kinase-like enzyme